MSPESFWSPTMSAPVCRVLPLEKYSVNALSCSARRTCAGPIWNAIWFSDELLMVQLCVVVKL